MAGPWYETVEISAAEVKTLFEKEYKEKVTNIEALREIINSVVPDDVSLGSYRGYYTFLHAMYKKQIEERIKVQSVDNVTFDTL